MLIKNDKDDKSAKTKRKPSPCIPHKKLPTCRVDEDLYNHIVAGWDESGFATLGSYLLHVFYEVKARQTSISVDRAIRIKGALMPKVLTGIYVSQDMYSWLSAEKDRNKATLSVIMRSILRSYFE